MAQRSHVPKFGNWDGDNVPYTVYFDTARKEKSGTGMINPNDPSENPEAFKFGFTNGNESEVSGPTSVERSAVSSEKYHGDTEGHTRPRPYRNGVGGGGGGDYHKSCESSSDKSNLDYSVLNLPTHLNDNTTDPWKKKKNPNDNRLRGVTITNPNDDVSYKSASVPKFGTWDDQDPKSGEGFTVIFNKVKEEKQTAAAKFPPVQVQYQPTNTPHHQFKCSSKRYCCLF